MSKILDDLMYPWVTALNNKEEGSNERIIIIFELINPVYATFIDNLACSMVINIPKYITTESTECIIEGVYIVINDDGVFGTLFLKGTYDLTVIQKRALVRLHPITNFTSIIPAMKNGELCQFTTYIK